MTATLTAARELCRAAGLVVVRAHAAPENSRVIYVEVEPFSADPKYKIERIYGAMVKEGVLFGIGHETVPERKTTTFRFEVLGATK